MQIKNLNKGSYYKYYDNNSINNDNNISEENYNNKGKHYMSKKLNFIKIILYHFNFI
jgi:hypothetical protein